MAVGEHGRKINGVSLCTHTQSHIIFSYQIVSDAVGASQHLWGEIFFVEFYTNRRIRNSWKLPPTSLSIRQQLIKQNIFCIRRSSEWLNWFCVNKWLRKKIGKTAANTCVQLRQIKISAKKYMKISSLLRLSNITFFCVLFSQPPSTIRNHMCSSTLSAYQGIASSIRRRRGRCGSRKERMKLQIYSLKFQFIGQWRILH